MRNKNYLNTLYVILGDEIFVEFEGSEWSKVNINNNDIVIYDHQDNIIGDFVKSNIKGIFESSDIMCHMKLKKIGG